MTIKDVQNSQILTTSEPGSTVPEPGIGQFRSKTVNISSRIAGAINRAISGFHDKTAIIKNRACIKMHKMETFFSTMTQTIKKAVRRAVICGTTSGVAGGIMTTAAVGLLIGTSPWIGVPIAFTAGMATSGGFATAGAIFGAAWPITKEAVKRLTKQNVRVLEQEITTLKLQLKEKNTAIQ